MAKPVSSRPKFGPNIVDVTCIYCEKWIGSQFLELSDGEVTLVIPLCHRCINKMKKMDHISDADAELMLKRLVHRGLIDTYSME